MEKVLSSIEENRQHNLDRVFECLRMETVSADSSKKGEISRCGEWLGDWLKQIGFENIQIVDSGGLPIVLADWLHAGKDKPTVLVYGHYDVQPAEPLDLWESPPFEPTIRDGRIYARGTADDKCQFMMHLFALEAFMKTRGALPINIKVILESEEENKSGWTDKFVEDHPDLLSCDAAMLSDTAWPTDDQLALVYGLRGIVYFEVRVKGPNRDLHSGRFGGIVQNPLYALAYMISKLQDVNGHVNIPGFYEDVAILSDEERAEIAKLGNPDEDIKKYLEVNTLWGEPGFTTYERNWTRPSFDVNGIWGGYSGEGSKTVIPSEAGCKVSMRLVPNQDPKKIRKVFESYVKEIAPPGVTVEVEFIHDGTPVVVPLDDPFLRCARKAVEEAFKVPAAMIREGASVPIAATFAEALHAPPIMMGFDVPTGNIHAPNENFILDNFYKGIEACAYFYEGAAGVKK